MVSPGTSIDLCVLRDACHELFCVVGDFYTSGTQDTEVRVSISYFSYFLNLFLFSPILKLKPPIFPIF